MGLYIPGKKTIELLVWGKSRIMIILIDCHQYCGGRDRAG